MNADLVQYVLYAAFAALGWWLRHKGILGPRSTTPVTPAGAINQQLVIDLLKSLLDRLTTMPAPPPAPTPSQPAAHVITVPFEVAARPKTD